MTAVFRKLGERVVEGACRRRHVRLCRGVERNVEGGGFGRGVFDGSDSQLLERAGDVMQVGGEGVAVGCTTHFRGILI